MQVASFLAITHPAFNPTLVFVLGSALVVALPMFQLVIKKRTEALDGCSMDLPSSSMLDPELLVGGVLFGLGWGALSLSSEMCLPILEIISLHRSDNYWD